MTPFGGRPSRARARDLPDRSSAFRSMMRWAVLPNLVVAPVVAVVSALVWQPSAAYSALGAMAVTMAFFALGLLVLRMVLDGPTAGALAGALGVYLMQMFVLFWLFVALQGIAAIHPAGFVAGALTATVVWQAGQIIGLVRARQFVFTEPNTTREGQ